jgi:hypothetical protein
LDKGQAPIFFGCGVRHPRRVTGIEFAEVFSVRGPVSAFCTGFEGPMGDSAFILKKIYSPKNIPAYNNKKILIPHLRNLKTASHIFRDTDVEVVSPLVEGGKEELLKIIDKTTSSSFVYADSLHAGIIATIYDIPFCFCNFGFIDIPTKYIDFAASIGADFFWINGLDSNALKDASPLKYGAAFKRFNLSPLLIAFDSLAERIKRG